MRRAPLAAVTVAVVAALGAATIAVAPGADGATTTLLTVTVSGEGTVTSDDLQVSCPDQCQATYKPADVVTLTAVPADGWTLATWSDSCKGTDPCTLTMDTDHKATAEFVYSGVSDLGATSYAGAFADAGAGGEVVDLLAGLVGNDLPKPDLAGPTSTAAGSPVELSASGSSDPGGEVVGYRWDLDGDDAFDDAFGPTATFLGSRAGKRPVAVQVMDKDGGTAVARSTITVTGTTGVPSVASAVKSSGPRRSLAGSFDDGLTGWRVSGGAFKQPTSSAKLVHADQVVDSNGRLGGTYLDGVSRSSGAAGDWVTSFHPGTGDGLSVDADGDLPTGLLVSQPFRVTRARLAFRLGGGGSFASGDERAELWARGDAGWSQVRSAVASRQEVLRPTVWDVSKLKGRDAVVAVVDGSSLGHVSVDQFTLTDAVLTAARDTTYYTLTPAQRAGIPRPTAIVGMGDFHAHPEGAQGFGALRGIRSIMGVVGGDVAAYATDPHLFADDVYSDDTYHLGGGPLAKFGLDVAEGRASRTDTGAALDSLAQSHWHSRYGGPCTGTCDRGHVPGTIGPAHEAMNVFEIHRAWQGGLRLMSSLAVNSTVLEYLGGDPRRYDGGGPEADLFGAPTEHDGDLSVNQVATTPEKQVILAQVEGMRQLADLNSSWMGIAYDPQGAYDLMRQGKLAIVLGTEIDTTGDLGFPTPEDEVAWMWGLGIRQVTPVHCCDSRIGGAALFQDDYNMANDLANRPRKDITALRVIADIDQQGLAIQPKAGFGGTPQVGYFLRPEAACHGTMAARGVCVRWRLSAPDLRLSRVGGFGKQSMASIDGTALTALTGPAGTGATVHPAPFDRIPDDYYATYESVPVGEGMRNQLGLTSYGRRYLLALMHKGMVVDMEHMSDKMIQAVIDPGTAGGHTRGPVWSLTNQTPCQPGTFQQSYAACWGNAYPLMSSHTSYRAQSLDPSGTFVKGFVAREFERTPEQVEYIRRSGGVVGPVLLHDPVRAITERVASATGPTWQLVDGRDWGTTSSVANNCAASTRSWVQAYLYSLAKMGGRGVGVGSDMILVGGPAPRFGASAPERPGGLYSCSASRATEENEEGVFPAQYARSAQTDPVDYARPVDALGAGDGRLRQEVDPAGVVKDYNTQGMLTYGQLPDLLQDARNVGVTPHDLAPLFSSAQSYVDMWSKAYGVAGCAGSTYDRCAGNTVTPIDAAACRNTCPMDPGRGQSLAPDGTPYTLQRLW